MFALKHLLLTFSYIGKYQHLLPLYLPSKTPNVLYIRRKQCVQVWRDFVHSYSVNCCCSLSFRTHDGQTFLQKPECTRSTSYTPLQTPIYHISRHFVTAHFFHLTNMVTTRLALAIACSGIQCGLKYQHWPMKRTVLVDQKGCQWRIVPI